MFVDMPEEELRILVAAAAATKCSNNYLDNWPCKDKHNLERAFSRLSRLFDRIDRERALGSMRPPRDWRR